MALLGTLGRLERGGKDAKEVRERDVLDELGAELVDLDSNARCSRSIGVGMGMGVDMVVVHRSQGGSGKCEAVSLAREGEDRPWILVDILVHAEQDPLGYALELQLVAQTQERGAVRPDRAGRSGLEVHQVKHEFEELGVCRDGDGVAGVRALSKEGPEVGADTVSKLAWGWAHGGGIRKCGITPIHTTETAAGILTVTVGDRSCPHPPTVLTCAPSEGTNGP